MKTFVPSDMKKKLFDRSSSLRLIVLAFVLLAFWLFQGSRPLSQEETGLYRRVRAAQDHLWAELGRRGVEFEAESDIDRTGFIGVEWSSITTTLGSLESKRSSCDPLWAVQTLRWFDRLGLVSGDRVAVLSSSSFPGMLFSVLAAAETRGLDIDLTVSLGSSTWGANRPAAPWPVMAEILRAGGFLKTRPHFYTPGGGSGENGGGMLEDGLAALELAVQKDSAELFRPSSLSVAIERKMRLIDAPGRPKAKLVVSVGGSQANMGEDEAAITLPPGLLFPEDRLNGGDGVIGLALRRGYPVLHLLNLHLLADRAGIAYDTRRPKFATGRSTGLAAAGVLLFVLAMATHRRWTWEE